MMVARGIKVKICTYRNARLKLRSLLLPGSFIKSIVSW
jgi:hypothetical protein